MNAVVDFLKSGWGRGLLLAIFGLFAISTWHGCHPARAPSPIPSPTNSNSLQVTDRAGSIPAPLPRPALLTNAQKRSVILSIDANLLADTNEVSSVFAPAGCSLKCVLVNSLESIRINTPVIGRVIENLWFNDKLVVPRDARVFGKAEVDRVRDRLAAAGTWTVVFPTGEEIIVQGSALHCDESPDGRHHGPDDGTAGFKGEVVHSTATWDELKLFASTFLAGVARSQQQNELTIYGPQPRQSAQNGLSAGTAAVLDDYAHSIADAIKRDGSYVHVNGGSSFYLFLPQTLDRAAARAGASRHTNAN